MIHLFFVITATFFSYSQPPQVLHSALRYPGETAQLAYRRYNDRLNKSGHRTQVVDTPVKEAKLIQDLNVQAIPEWKSQYITIEKAFVTLRDIRFLKDPEVGQKQFLRRSSWLYPADGCFARATLMRTNLEQLKVNPPAKLFIFGELKVSTYNSPSGQVRWWYHVVPVYRLGQTVVVLDPAINPYSPMKLNDWVMSMTKDINSVKLAVCKPMTFAPGSSCYSPDDDYNQGLDYQYYYLRAERQNLKNLGRDAEAELGEYPPWLKARRR